MSSLSEPQRDIFVDQRQQQGERRLWPVVALTFCMMVLEIAAGHTFGSAALVADGWHMSTHAAALALSALAYRLARRFAHDRRFAFGAGKLGELAAFASAIGLLIIAALIALECTVRLMTPVPIRFDEAILVASIGLIVNLASAWFLAGGDHPAQEQHGPRTAVTYHDTNFKAAFLHVLADALTSVLAILALISGRFNGWLWLDPVIGIVGACVIAWWARGLIWSASGVLLDLVPDEKLAAGIRSRLEIDGDRVADLRLWRTSPSRAALVATIVSASPKPPDAYRRRLVDISGLAFVSLEVCPSSDAANAGPAGRPLPPVDGASRDDDARIRIALPAGRRGDAAA